MKRRDEPVACQLLPADQRLCWLIDKLQTGDNWIAALNVTWGELSLTSRRLGKRSDVQLREVLASLAFQKMRCHAVLLMREADVID